MMPKDPKYRRPLNQAQLHTLKLVFKFRYVTAPLLVSLFGTRGRAKSRQSVYKTLEILLAQDYLGKQYDSSYRIMGVQARYYLRPKAIRLISEELQLDGRALAMAYKNPSLTPDFVGRLLDTIKVYVGLTVSYPETFHIFTRSEQGRFDYFPEPRPDLYLNRITPSESGHNEYLLDVFTRTPLFAIKKRIDAYTEHFDEDDWQDTTDSDYPVVLIVVRDGRQEQQLRKYIANRLEREGLDDEMTFCTASLEALLSAENRGVAIWRDVMEPESLISLDGV